MAKLRPGQVAVDLLRLRLFALAGTPHARQFNQRLSQRHRHRQRARETADPHALHMVKQGEIARQRLRGQHRHLRARRALVAAQLRQPSLETSSVSA